MSEASTTSIKGEAYYYSSQQMGIDRRTKQFVVERCQPFIRGQKVLDLGFVDGCWTDKILESGWNSDIVEGSDRHVQAAFARYQGNERVRIIQSMFSEFKPDTSYNTIIAGDVLRYIDEPVEFLRRLRASLAKDGVIIITVPNSLSLHRRIGAFMGMEEHPCDLNARDREVGNLRSYDRYLLRSEILKAGLSIIELRGCFLKPLSSAQMETWDDKLLRAFLLAGDDLPNYSWFLYAVCAA
jgi:trans-aconitate methyltransferase